MAMIGAITFGAVSTGMGDHLRVQVVFTPSWHLIKLALRLSRGCKQHTIEYTLGLVRVWLRATENKDHRHPMDPCGS